MTTQPYINASFAYIPYWCKEESDKENYVEHLKARTLYEALLESREFYSPNSDTAGTLVISREGKVIQEIDLASVGPGTPPYPTGQEIIANFLQEAQMIMYEYDEGGRLNSGLDGNDYKMLKQITEFVDVLKKSRLAES